MLSAAMAEEIWDRVLALIDEGRLEEAFEQAEAHRDELPDSPQAHLLLGVVQAQMEAIEDALESFEEALSLDPGFELARLEKARLLYDEELFEDVIETLDESKGAEASLLLASALYELGENEESEGRLALALAEGETAEMRQLEATLRLARAAREDALASAERSVSLDPNDPASHHVLGLVFTQLGELERADSAFRRAEELDPDSYFCPSRLDGEEFDEAVDAAVAELPEEFQSFLENVEIAVEEVPDPALVCEGVEFDLLGLYQGSTIQSDGWDLPDRILLFQRNLENISPDRQTLLEEIRTTVHHEIAHHMGMDEEAVRDAEESSD